MQGVVIFLSSIVFVMGSYLVWPSRYNVLNHLSVGFAFIAYFIPTIILNGYTDYPDKLVNQYAEILALGAVFYIVGLFVGFYSKSRKTNYSFEVLNSRAYEKRAIKLTKIFLIAGITGMVLSFVGLGFIPMLAKDPLSAKFFRGQYQEPYQRVAILFRSSLFILSTIIPISLVIWYKYRDRFFLFATILSVGLIAMCLLRSLAFTGLMFAFATIMSFKSKSHFRILLICILGIYAFSAIFYLVLGINTTSDDNTTIRSKETNYWEVLSNLSPDINDQLNFMEMFNKKPVWTYGRTMYGGLVPGHYKWNPGVYTLNVVVPGEDVNDVQSGGLRLPVAIWGYVSFEWPGVIIICFLSGMIKGILLKYTKRWVIKYQSIVTRVIIMSISLVTFSFLSNFYLLSMYSIPPILILSFYMYRFKTGDRLNESYYPAIESDTSYNNV